MKRDKRRMHISKKTLTLLVSLVAILAMSVGSTLAWLAASGGELENKFAIHTPDIEIEETFDGLEKKNVKVTNNGELAMYVRVNLVFTWTDGAGNVIEKPQDASLSIKYGNWEQGSDGYWYYLKPLAVGQTTPNVLDSATVKKPAGADYGMTLEVLAQSIQAEPQSAVESAWDVTVGADGDLTIN